MSEASWRDEQLVRACDLVFYYTGEDTDQPTLEQLDATVMAWAADTSDRPDAGDIDNALGIAFGDILAEDAHLSWVVAGGSQDSDLAVHTADDAVVVFPRTIVAEYLDAGPTEPFFARLHGELTASLGRSPDSR
ncbi:MAG TPA: DUF3806 domain-containing protein [Nocardioidaceae bacterium]|nr:DUF3806 domain-containing protein [Nocardioidaceae bacterium]